MTIITRAALAPGGILFRPSRELPRDLHSIVDGRVVTWREVFEARTKRQQHRLEAKREFTEKRIYRVWVAYFRQSIMGGWQTFIDRKPNEFGTWVCEARKSWMIPELMKAFPLVIPARENFELWQRTFAKEYERRRKYGKPVGVAYVWWDKHGTPEPIERRTA